MIDTMTVDHFDDILIQARISKGGTAEMNSGDIASEEILISGQPENRLSLTISEVIE